MLLTLVVHFCWQYRFPLSAGHQVVTRPTATYTPKAPKLATVLAAAVCEETSRSATLPQKASVFSAE